MVTSRRGARGRAGLCRLQIDNSQLQAAGLNFLHSRFVRTSMRRIAVVCLSVRPRPVCVDRRHADATARAHLLRARPRCRTCRIAFRHADDIWLVGRDGGAARRLTSTSDVTDGPFFSPDGRTIAYTTAVARACRPRRLYDLRQWRCAEACDLPAGWEFRRWVDTGWARPARTESAGVGADVHMQLYRDACRRQRPGPQKRLPLPSMRSRGPTRPMARIWRTTLFCSGRADSWKRYRGGQTQPVIWVIDLKTLDLVKVPRENFERCATAIWLGDAVYFSLRP